MVHNSLLAKQSKYVFGVSKVEYLGHFISSERAPIDPKKITAVKQWPIPTTIKQLRVFLGFVRYYRKFIKGYGRISGPLNKLLRKDNFKWFEAAAQAFSTTGPVLALPDYSIPFIMEIDVSGTSIGVVLMQHSHPIAFIIKGLAPIYVVL
ncbi:uncharacterized mitochondrial protein AtMg00860-like [Nicotiana sylvestris]|uniref:uncharacterized mitochondrial protein AtMg00860-like n=1 Tax=Nicotiana sylvestris TaxID=4096 RepID=UPI00388C781A